MGVDSKHWKAVTRILRSFAVKVEDILKAGLDGWVGLGAGVVCGIWVFVVLLLCL